MVVTRARLYLNTFRGEPAISGFAWHFTPTLRSSLPFVTDMGAGLHVRVPRASPCPRVDHPVSGRLDATSRPFGLAFAPAPAVQRLNLATPTHSLAHSTKGTPSPPPTGGSSDRPEAHGFRVCFTPLDGVLFTVPSRYWFAIGRDRYLALGRGRPCFPPDSACPAVLTIRNHSPGQAAGYGTLTPSGRPFQQRSPLPGRASDEPADSSIALVQPPPRIGGSLYRAVGLGSSRFARRYYGNPLCSSGYVRCFSSPGALPRQTWVSVFEHGRVAPFGVRRITRSQPFPCAFRGVGASFIGLSRLGIHHVPISGSCPVRTRTGSWLRGARGNAQRSPATGTPQGAAPFGCQGAVCPTAPVEPRGFEPRTSAVQGRRSPG